MSNLHQDDINQALNQLSSVTRLLERMTYDTDGGITPTEYNMLDIARHGTQQARLALNNLDRFRAQELASRGVR